MFLGVASNDACTIGVRAQSSLPVMQVLDLLFSAVYNFKQDSLIKKGKFLGSYCIYNKAYNGLMNESSIEFFSLPNSYHWFLSITP